jgi:THO complex subunit 4
MISAKPRGRRGPRGGGRGAASGGAAPAREAAPRGAAGARARYSGSAPRNASQTQRAAAAPAAGKPITADATKIIISNLPTDVTEPQVRDLMQSTVGPVRSLHMAYTANGKSTGTATVIFKNRGDANKAHASCKWPRKAALTPDHNRMIDNR